MANDVDPFAHIDAAQPAADPFAHIDAAQPAPPPRTTTSGIAGSATRGAAPYAAGAAAGAAVGSVFGGVGAVPGALAGAGAVGATELVTGVYNALADQFGWSKTATPKQMTDKVLDFAGVKQPATGAEKMAEAVSGGAASAMTGAGAANMIANSVKGPVAKGVATQMAQGPVLQTVSGATSGMAAQTAAEMGAGPAGQMLAGLAGAVAPTGITGAARNAGRINASPLAKNAIEAGFVLPPAEASAWHIGEVNLANLAAGESGKIKVGQLASAKNQPLVNLYVQKELGLPPGTVLTPEVFDQVRAREGQVYREVAGAVPEVDLGKDPHFVKDAGQVGAPSKKTEELFPSTKEPPGLTALREELMQHARGDTQAVMNYIADLRFRATHNFQTRGDAQAHRMGAAQREAAAALEESLERSVKNAPAYYREKLDQAIAKRAEVTADLNYAKPQYPNDLTGDFAKKIEDARARVEAANAEVKGWESRLAGANVKNEQNQTLLDRFRTARTVMAKSYDAQSVSNVSTGDVSATGLGRLLQQGKPFTGSMKLIADSANSFHRAFQNPAAFGGYEPLSVFDFAAAGAAAMAGHPVAAASPLIRPWLRGVTLSPGRQRRMVSPAGPPVSPLPMLTDPGFQSVVQPNSADAATTGMTP